MSLTPSKATASFVTPTKRAALVSGTDAGPSRARPQGASPAYSSRKHSLYGVEDRVVIDPGSRIWKVGFSGEPEPRSVFWAAEEGQAWDIDLERIPGTRGDREEGRRVVEVNVLRKLRETFVKHLMTDAKSRKVIILESTFMPTYVKDAIAQALIDNLRVPSVSFTPSSLLALAASGRITGLVVNCGWLETTVTPVYHSRPLFHLARSTPLAGRALHDRLKLLLRHHATYTPPGSSSSSVRPETSVLTDRVVGRVLTEGCAVASSRTNSDVPTDAMDIDRAEDHTIEDEDQSARDLRERYGSSDLPSRSFRIPHSPLARDGTGILAVPGWILERAAEILFEREDDLESETVPEAILATLLKLPVDLRQTMISTILVVGGTSALPNYLPRLRDTILDALQSKSATQGTLSLAQWKKRNEEPYRELYGLSNKLAIINDSKAVDGRGGTAPRWTPGLMSWVGGSLAGALKTGAPEIIREDYDTLSLESAARGDHYRSTLEEADAEAEVAATVGISVKELQPGMALLGTGRRRGWRDGVSVTDWTRHNGTLA